MGSFFAREKLSEEAKVGMEQAGEDLANGIVDGFLSSITKLADFFKSLSGRIKGWIGSIDISNMFHLPSWLGGKTALQPIVQFTGHPQTSPVTTQATDKSKQSASVYHHQNVTVHVNGARDPLATGRAVSHALQRAKANAFIGLSRRKFLQDLDKDATGTLVRFFDVLAKSEQGMRSLIAIAGRDFTGDFAKLVGNPELLSQALEFVKDPKVFKGSVEQEADKQATGAIRQFELLQNRIVALGITIGNVLLPHVNNLMESVGNFINGLMAWANAHPALTSAIVKTISTLMAFNIALRVLRFTMAGTRLGLLQLMGSLIKIGGVSRALKTNWQSLIASWRSLGLMAATLGGSTLRLLRPMTLLVAAFRGLMVLSSAFAAAFGWVGTVIEVVATGIASVVGAVFSPIGALIAAVVAVIMAACFALWKYWDRFSSFVKGFARGLVHAFGRIFEAVMRFFGADTATITRWKNILAAAFDFSQAWQKFKQGLVALSQWFGNVLEGFKQSLSSFWSWLGSFFAREKLSEEAKVGMEQAGEDLANGIVDGFLSSITKLTDFFKSLSGRIKGWIGSIDFSNMFHLPSWLGGKTALQPIVQFAGHSQTSPVTPQATDKSKQNASVYHHQNVTVHVNGVRDPLATGRAVSHALQRAKANALHGGTE
ncbi:phage tail tape measure protein [Bartonella harrusi]|uniref:Phage tail tape measure protein n=1 Tax=Bartonella harrusi TaxID=2961895 RepID=A0ABY5EVV1_9HYPH|nr:phage tail tape measure protein [Bartonella harrusi]UTO27983.1 phage tail tape measure protein [Bartonella harrusi]UTO28044.1 phage tail tape measure protein [Bartonella harrusi]